ncbi:Non-specific serine/threonine protein kinase protein [Dioscorea alata]|uniref:Non-specific serine/threonine protein kinase protein n=1 Tax=Dioscorea alata TaxID=55571 RepID=A0ACB7UAW9_DIOAL|nr:Non-specific serine/threonine protein kinase protein [Dioscorea alata]
MEDYGPFRAYTQTVVAVDRDKNSMHAVKWAADHLLISNPAVILIHVRSRGSTSHPMTETSSELGREHQDSGMTEFFLPYRGFCARRGIQLKEVVLEENDVSKAIIEYVNLNHISNIAVGAPNKLVFTFARKFRNPDIPERILKSAPEYCTVYVIAKGKPMTIRSAKSPAPISAMPPRQILSPRQIAEGGFHNEEQVRGQYGKNGMRVLFPAPDRRSIDRGSDFMKTPTRGRPLSSAKTVPPNMLLEAIDPAQQSRNSFSDDADFSKSMRFQSMDFAETSEFISGSIDNPLDSQPSPIGSAQKEIEAEIKRLRLELKQTMDMYSSACKEAISAKQKARELHQWKTEESKKVEALRQAEGAALELAEMEKAKCKAAIEAAEESQKIAELEAKKRLDAELKATHEEEEKKKALDALAQNDVRYRKYTIDEIETATQKFSENLKIGEGGYGPVYKATLDHTPVAIKVLRPDAAQGRKQFQQEVEVLSCIRHPNMVLLLGACPEYGCLVYEYLDNGSLEDRLFRRGNTPVIPWSVRFKIAAEIATGLLFLHQAKPEPLVHRDLKPANILLDRNYVSKISDVGLARLVPPSVANNVTQYRMTSTAGTFCYIDPEYQQTGMLGIKSDIYSLGIMLLQIITGKPPMGLTHHVERAIEKGTFSQMLDPAIKDWPEEDALIFAKLSLKCAELRRKDRPDLGSIVLPELNRLRELGHEYEAQRGNMYFNMAQVLSTQNASAPWAESSEECKTFTQSENTKEKLEEEG